jgi:hypothetical protein
MEDRFLLPPPHSLFKIDNIWRGLFMSKSLCRYGIQQYTKDRSLAVELLMAIAANAPHDVLVLPDITALFRQHRKLSQNIAGHVIETHRPIPILTHMFQLYNRSCHDLHADEFCVDAAASNNIAALSWLRDPNTSDGVYPWTRHTCAAAAEHGHLATLQRLRDPLFGGGVCPWSKAWCLYVARYWNYTAMATWIETQPDDP